jgi:hypothetical protein
MRSAPKKNNKAFIQTLNEGGWFPKESAFRVRMNIEARQALLHALATGDITIFGRLIDAIPSSPDKEKIKSFVIEKLPFQISKPHGQFAKDKGRWAFLAEGIIANFNLMDSLVVSKSAKGAIRFDVGDIALEEFVSIAADVFVLNRRAFTKEQIDHLIDVLQNISTRKNTTYA